MAAAGQSQRSENKSRARISSLSRFLGTHKAAMKWKSSLLLSEYFTKKTTRDPGTFDVDYNDTPAVRKMIEKSRKMFYLEDMHLDEISFMNKPQNSYELSPVKPFKVSEVREIMKNAMREINDEKNKHETDADLCKSLADEIKLRVKNSGFSRYKIICVVSLLRGCERQKIMIGSRCLWNTDYDNFVQEIFESKRFTAVATVYALYYE
jgi:hypothetical protein